VLARSRRIGRDARKAIRRLDLERPRTAVRGPYLWFSFVTEAIQHSVARLIVDYNRCALPQADVARAGKDDRDRYAAWLERRPGSGDAWARGPASRTESHVTTEFTALHFLDDDPRRDREVRERFGLAVLHRLEEDRRLLFRRVFGTYPHHERPRDQRVVNLYRLYESWLSGGRALWLPLRVMGRSFLSLARGWSWMRRAVHEIRRPALRSDVMAAAGADFTTAVRKIDRMRGPVLRTCLRLRSWMDAEYLGFPLPGETRTGLEGHDVDADLEFLRAAPAVRAEVEEERRRAERDLARLSRLLDAGLLGEESTRERLRAAVACYRGDLDGVRTLLSCEEILREARESAPRAAPRPWRLPLSPRLARAFRRWWKAHGGGGARARRATWRAVRDDVDGAGRALRAWAALGPAGSRAAGERALAEALRHPERVTEELVTLRAVQTLALIDVLNYRGHVWRLGRYADDGEEPGGLLSLDGVTTAPPAGP
jgi:hypothetical protein